MEFFLVRSRWMGRPVWSMEFRARVAGSGETIWRIGLLDAVKRLATLEMIFGETG